MIYSNFRGTAANSIAMNNFESSTMSQALTNISNGNERLYISATDRLLTTGRIDTVYLRNSLYDGGSWNWDTNATDNYGINTNPSSVRKTNLIGRDEDLITSVSFDGIVGSSDSDSEWEGWTRVIENFADPYELNLRKGMVWKQSLVFYNTSDPALSRTCSFTRRRPFELYVDVQDYVAANAGQPCRVDIKIPAGLTEARFPLEFNIEQEKNTLYPNAESEFILPVGTGPSQIPGRSGNNYYFTGIRPASVDGIRTFPSYFKTLVGDSATTVWVMPATADGHFAIYDDVEDVFTNKDSFLNAKVDASISFDQSSLVIKAGDNAEETIASRTNVATSTSGAEVTYSSSDPAVATVSADGVVTGLTAGTVTIGATCPAKGAYNAVSSPVTYTLTVAAADKKLPGFVVNWTREPVTIYKTGSSRTAVSVYAVTEEGSPGAITVSYESSNSSVAKIEQSGDTYYVTPVAAGTAIITATASIAASGDFVADTRTLSYEVTVTSGYAAPGTVFHHETFLGRNPEQPTTLQTDYESKWQSVDPATSQQLGTGYKPLWYQVDGDGNRLYYIDPSNPEAETTTTDNGNPVTGFTDTGDANKVMGPTTFHGQTSLWHQHPSGDYGAYVNGWHDQDQTNGVNWTESSAWLVSPEIDLAASQSAKLTFSHAASYHLYPEQMTKWAKVMLILASDYNGSAAAPEMSKWVDISPDPKFYPFPDYKFVAAAVDLTPWAGKKIRIAFWYTSSSDASHGSKDGSDPNCSWEVKNVTIKEN